jgi:hypothetical protein
MKKFFFLLLLVVGFAALTAQANAGYYGSRYGGYHGYYRRPVHYGYYHGPRYYSYWRPHHSYYHYPRYYYPTHYYPSYGFCAPVVRAFFPGPRFSFFFGF